MSLGFGDLKSVIVIAVLSCHGDLWIPQCHVTQELSYDLL